MPRKPALVLDPNACTGCRSCELACSLKTAGRLAPRDSLIRIFRPGDDDQIAWSLDPRCDLCEGEAVPRCIRFCPRKAIGLTLVCHGRTTP